MKQTISGTFPQSGTPGPGAGYVCQDWAPKPKPANGTPQWTAGAAASQQLTALSGGVPATTVKAMLLSWSVSAYLGFTTTGPGDAVFGKLGKIVAGLSPIGLSTVKGTFNQPWSVALPSVPADATLTATLWDPSVDMMPPQIANVGFTSPAGLLPVSVAMNLANPLPIDASSLPTIATWMWPSLLGQSAGASTDLYGLSLLFGSFTVNYDDGLTP